MLNPCCCISPRVGTLIFGVVDLVISGLWAAEFVSQILNGGGKYINTWVRLGLAVLLVFFALLLIFGALRKEARKIRLWLILMIVYIVCMAIFSILDIYDHGGIAKFGPKDGGQVGGIIVLLYQMWVVWAYLHELQYGPAALTYCPTQVI